MIADLSRSRGSLYPLFAALACAAIAVAALLGAAPASASTTHTMTLSLTGGGRLDVRAGDSVTFTVATGLDQVTASLPGGAGGVLKNGTSRTVTLDTPGTYTVSWTVQKIVTTLLGTGPLAKTVTSLTTIATCTATVVVAPVVAQASSVVAKVTQAAPVPKLHVSVSVPVSKPAEPPAVGGDTSAPRGGAPTTPRTPPADPTAAAGSTMRSSRAAAASPATPTRCARSSAASGGGSGGAAGVFVNNVPGNGGYQPAAMNRLQPPAGTGGGGHAAHRGDAESATGLGSARVPVLLAVLAILALAAVTVGYARVYLFRRMV